MNRKIIATNILNSTQLTSFRLCRLFCRKISEAESIDVKSIPGPVSLQDILTELELEQVAPDLEQALKEFTGFGFISSLLGEKLIPGATMFQITYLGKDNLLILLDQIKKAYPYLAAE